MNKYLWYALAGLGVYWWMNQSTPLQKKQETGPITQQGSLPGGTTVGSSAPINSQAQSASMNV